MASARLTAASPARTPRRTWGRTARWIGFSRKPTAPARKACNCVSWSASSASMMTRVSGERLRISRIVSRPPRLGRASSISARSGRCSLTSSTAVAASLAAPTSSMSFSAASRVRNAWRSRWSPSMMATARAVGNLLGPGATRSTKLSTPARRPIVNSDPAGGAGKTPVSAPTRIRTWGLLLRRESLYPAELSGRICVIVDAVVGPGSRLRFVPRLRCSFSLASILGVLLLGGVGSTPASAANAEPAAASDSALISPCDLGAGPRFRCGRITVPAVRGEPQLGDQSIFFAVRPRDEARKPALGTIFAVEGGPGYASTNFDSAKSYRAVFRPLLRRRDLVLIDQRGTGHSQAVNCPQLQRSQVPEVVAVASCANQLGPRYQGFTSAESAADLEAVLTALGLGPIALYGDSYGTLLAQAYSVRYPARL